MGREKRVKGDLAGKKGDIAQRGMGKGKKKGKGKKEKERKESVEDPDLAPSPNMLI